MRFWVLELFKILHWSVGNELKEYLENRSSMAVSPGWNLSKFSTLTRLYRVLEVENDVKFHQQLFTLNKSFVNNVIMLELFYKYVQWDLELHFTSWRHFEFLRLTQQTRMTLIGYVRNIARNLKKLPGKI